MVLINGFDLSIAGGQLTLPRPFFWHARVLGRAARNCDWSGSFLIEARAIASGNTSAK
jgi:hypothetical protein